jgi:hypothetical protein
MFGWSKDKYDKRDYLHRPMRAIEIPSIVDLSAQLPPVRDQLNLGACVGFGIGGNLCTRAKLQGVFSEWFSPTWIYNGARYVEGSLNRDAGAMPRDALDFLVKRGCLLERFWPYTGVLDRQAPPSRFDTESSKYPLISYTRVTGDVEGIRSALASGYCVSLGAPWFSSWMEPGPTGVLPHVTDHDAVAGGHETYLFGFDVTVNRFWGVNSWGTKWGNNGRYFMPFSSIEIFKKAGGYDAHYIDVDWGIVPPAPPSPTPGPDASSIEARLAALEERVEAAGVALRG